MFKHTLTIIAASLLLLAAVIIGAASIRSMMAKKTVSNGNGNTPAKTMEGNWLAGNKSFFFVFTKDDYQRALDGDKVIFLSFYADWCPFCRAEEPEIEAGFNALESDKVIGFRVNYNDGETDADEKALAEQLRITYQHTKVILVDGKEVFRTGDTWTRGDFSAILPKYSPQ